MPAAVLDGQRRVRSLIGWMGGKRQLAERIVGLLPPHRCYVEVFGGAGSVLFAKPPSKVEVYNDADRRLIELFRSVRFHLPELRREVKALLASRQEFEGFMEQPGLTEIQRAARFFYIVRMSFGCKARHFASGPSRRKGWHPLEINRGLVRVRRRLEPVLIEHKDFEALIARFDGHDTVFFCDPPYWGCEDEYTVTLERADHARLARALKATRARWLLTYNDCAEVRALYAWARLHMVRADYSTGGAGGKGWAAGHQLIITNYRLTAAHLRDERFPLAVVKE